MPTDLSANNSKIWQWQADGGDLLSKEDWESLRQGLDYGEEKQKKKEETATVPEEREKSYNPDFSGMLQWLIIALIAVALIFVILRILGIRNFNRRVAGKKSGFTQMELLSDEPGDTTGELSASIEAGDYRNAIRLLYLFVLRSFHEQGLLKWKKDKTNADYLRELRSHRHYPTFKKLTRIYEHVWFGESEITAGIYSDARTCYESLTSRHT